MTTTDHPYESFYRYFDTPLMRLIRREAYGEDIGQHSWVTADDLRADVVRLALTRETRLLDLGCGPCGPLTFILDVVGCEGIGVDESASALIAGRERAAALGVESRLTSREANLDESLPFDDASFDAAISLDVILHLRDRARLFRQAARVLRPGARFLFTDAGVVTGVVSGDEIRERSANGYTQFAAPGMNERLLEQSGFELVETEDRTAGVVRNASGRLEAMRAHRVELERTIGTAVVERQQRYLETVVALAERRALSRMMYVAERR